MGKNVEIGGNKASLKMPVRGEGKLVDELCVRTSKCNLESV